MARMSPGSPAPEPTSMTSMPSQEEVDEQLER